MAKKIKKYQGKTGSSSVKDSTTTPTDKLEQMRINRDKARLMDYIYGVPTTPRDYTPKITQPKPNTTPGPMVNPNTMEINKQSREAKKGGAMKPITALDQVDKMYKAKYKK